MPIGDYCAREPVTVSGKQTAREAAEQMKQRNCGSLLVVERGHPVGVLTDRDLALGLIAKRRDPDRTQVKDVMSQPVVTIPEGASVAHAARVMRRSAVRRLPVVDDKGKLVGIVTSDDVFRLVADEIAGLRHALDNQNPQHSAIPAAAGG